MRITSTVTSPITGNKVKPVVISSIVAPQVGASASGSLAVQVKGAAGQPIPGVSVSAVGPKSVDPETTNDLGCAVFGELTAGTYGVTLAKPGFVDKEGQASPSNDASVTVGTTSTIEFAYDEAAGVTLNVKDKPADTAEPAKTVVAGERRARRGPAHVRRRTRRRSSPPSTTRSGSAGVTCVLGHDLHAHEPVPVRRRLHGLQRRLHGQRPVEGDPHLLHDVPGRQGHPRPGHDRHADRQSPSRRCPSPSSRAAAGRQRRPGVGVSDQHAGLREHADLPRQQPRRRHNPVRRAAVRQLHAVRAQLHAAAPRRT